MSHRGLERAAVVACGSAMGLLAGTVMGLAAMIHAGTVGLDPFGPVRQVAAVWYGIDALIGGEGIVGMGVITHLVVSMVLGVVFAAYGPRRGGAAVTVVGGLAYGTLVWAVFSWVLLPLVDPIMHERVRLFPSAWYVLHLVFGALLSPTPYLVRLMARTPQVAPA